LLEGGKRAFIERERRYRIERPSAVIAHDGDDDEASA
jgi:hypothetical protein